MINRMIDEIIIPYKGKEYRVDLGKGIDISIPINKGNDNPNCYWAKDVEFETIRFGDFIGSVKEGGTVNYQRLMITPHGNGTHTECYGHISPDPDATINRCLKKFFFLAELITLSSNKNDHGDLVITFEEYKEKTFSIDTEALIIRTLPNDNNKLSNKYSGTNPPYFDWRIMQDMCNRGVLHVLVDLPSVDPEKDGGKLLAHKTFWRYPNSIRSNATITELIYVENDIPDGRYLLNLQISSLEMDASPSKPILYKI